MAAFLPAIAQVGSTLLQNLINKGNDKPKKLSNFDKGQKNVFSNLTNLLGGLGMQGGGVNNALGLLQQYFDPNSDVYKNFEKPYLQQFEQETIPMLAERFAGLGAQGGALSSSGFGQALSSAGSNLQTNLAQMKSGLQNKSLTDFLNLYMQLNQQALGAQPFSYLNRENAGGASGNLDLSQLGQLFANMGSGGGSGNQYPLTNSYDLMFRQQGLPG